MHGPRIASSKLRDSMIWQDAQRSSEIMPQFDSDGVDIAYDVAGRGRGLSCSSTASPPSARVNWRDTGWVKILTEAGYTAITFDNRGHGEERQAL